MVKNCADYDQIIMQKKISKIGITDDVKYIDEYFRTYKRFKFLKYLNNGKKDNDIDIRKAVNIEVIKDINKKK